MRSRDILVFLAGAAVGAMFYKSQLDKSPLGALNRGVSGITGYSIY